MTLPVVAIVAGLIGFTGYIIGYADGYRRGYYRRTPARGPSGPVETALRRETLQIEPDHQERRGVGRAERGPTPELVIDDATRPRRAGEGSE